jgi:hypothetical protein
MQRLRLQFGLQFTATQPSSTKYTEQLVGLPHIRSLVSSLHERAWYHLQYRTSSHLEDL